MKIGLTISIYLAFIGYSFGQQHNFRNYAEDEGLNEKYTYHLSQNKQGYLSLSTSEGLIMFGGNDFRKFDETNGLNENFVTTHLSLKNGRMILGHFQKGLTLLENFKFTSIKSDSIYDSKVSNLLEYKNDLVLVGTQGKGLWVLRDTVLLKVSGFKGYSVNHILKLNKNEIAISTNQGIHRGTLIESENGFKFDYSLLDNEDQSIVKICKFNNSEYWFINKSGEIYQYIIKNGKSKIKRVLESSVFNDAILTDLVFKNKKNLWVSTLGEGVYKFSFINKEHTKYKTEHYSKENGLPGNSIQCMFLDVENNIWFGTYGAGISVLPNQKFTVFNESSGLYNNEVTCVSVGADDDIWVGNHSGLNLLKLGNEFSSIQFSKKDGFTNDRVNSTYFDKDENKLWIGTLHNGLYYYDYNNSKFIYLNDKYQLPRTSINYITGDTDKIYLATDEGIVVINKTNGKIIKLNTSNGCPHNIIKYIYLQDNGVIWFASHGIGPFKYDKGKFTVYKDIEGLRSFNLNSITSDLQGNIWFASNGDGIFKMDPEKETFTNYTTENGLRSNYCRTIFSNAKNEIWVGHKNGLSQKPHDSDIFFQIKSEGTNMVIENNRNSFYLDKNDDIWFGTSQGLIRYDHLEDYKNRVSPSTMLLGVNINNEYFSPFQKNNLIKLKSGKYSLEFVYLGISFVDPSRVKYKYRLLGFDDKWIEVGNNSRKAYFPKIPSGEYTFQVIACNNDGIYNTKPVEIKIFIDEPLIKKWWFLLISSIVIIGIIYLVFYIRDRNNKAVQQYLEKNLRIRTSELVETNKGLEEANKEITESILYAKRIQRAVMPDLEELEEHADKAFILYKPKDIVAGDFYWFTKMSNKLILIAADCTGHGVPGAMLSMIGATLFDKIINGRNLTAPKKIIDMLDENFNVIIRQFIGNTKYKVLDGMDLGIAVIDFETQSIEYVGAERPLYKVDKNGELEEYKGSPYSIGAYLEQTKDFKLTKLKFEKGDSIYLSSDGYADQFGGPKNKKILQRNLKSKIAELGGETPENKYFELNKFFVDWKGEEEQTDDVLIIGFNL